jgi:hypothetical protein
MIKEVTMYTILCDGCGKDVCDGTEYSAWNDTSYVVDSAIEDNWHVEDGNHYCPNCFEYDDDDNLIIKGGNK